MTGRRFGVGWIYAFLIFLAGISVGLMLAPSLMHSFMRPPEPGKMAEFLFKTMKSRLELTEAQAAQVKLVTDRAGQDLKQLWSDTVDRVSVRVEEMRSEVTPLLTPEQRLKLEKLNAEGKARLQKDKFSGPP